MGACSGNGARRCWPGEALGQAGRAKAQTTLAERESKRAKAQTDLAEQRLYDVEMSLVQRNWEDYHGRLMGRLLDEQLPANQSGVDRRGFEWFYWRRKSSSGRIMLKGHPDDRFHAQRLSAATGAESSAAVEMGR